MAIKGLSKPICADYIAEGNRVTYSEPYAANKAVEYGMEVEASEDNDLHADNEVTESAAGKFQRGSLSLKTADFEPGLSKKILGLKEITKMFGEKEITEIVFDDDMKTTEKGFGIIEEHEIAGITTYLPIIFPRVLFNLMSNAATTRGKEIEWQTKEITGNVMRSAQVDENYNKPWQISPEEGFETEAEAEAYIKEFFTPKVAAK